MERDALLAHGTAFLLKDRLMNCSDYSTAWVCRTCGSLISLGFDELKNGEEADLAGREFCRICERSEQVRIGREVGAKMENEEDPLEKAKQKGVGVGLISKGKRQMDVVAVPYVFRYVSFLLSGAEDEGLWLQLCAEMACMGIRLNVTVT
jgi:DNA-directed RNA polymerase I subunit RPA2